MIINNNNCSIVTTIVSLLMTSRLNRWGARGGAGSQCVGPRPGKSR